MDKVTDKTTGFHFTIIDNYILNSAGLNALEQIVYIHLKQYSAMSSKCFTGINKLADRINLSTNTVRKVLKKLKEKGYLDIKQRFNSSNEYTLLPYPEYARYEDTDINTAAEEDSDSTSFEGLSLEILGCERSDGERVAEEDEEREKTATEKQASQKQSGEKTASGIALVLLSYQNNINSLYGSMERDKLISWFNTFEGNGDILIKAIEVAVLQGVRKIKYIESVLINWHQCGIKTIEQCEAYLKEREEKRREGKNGTGSPGKNNEPCETGTGSSSSRYDFSKFS